MLNAFLKELELIGSDASNDGGTHIWVIWVIWVGLCGPSRWPNPDGRADWFLCGTNHSYVLLMRVILQWEMICDRQTLNAAATSIYFLGMWVGAIVFGYMSDR